MKSRGWVSCVAMLALGPLPALAEMESEPVATPPAAVNEANPETASAEPAMPAVEPVAGRVARASFTIEVVDREPQGSVTTLPNDRTRILFFTELRDMEGHTVEHVWEFDAKEMARVPIAVKAPRWRAYSAKNLDPSWLGGWTVSVVDEQGRELGSERFSYVAAAAVPPVVDSDTAPPAEQATAADAPAEMQPPAAPEETPGPGDSLPASGSAD